ncbi:MAG TPA: carbohydrate porin [Puia sp.]|jgi:high affinity Mn2+ porin|nr:carbohydrate porin [Puia sp.]
MLLRLPLLFLSTGLILESTAQQRIITGKEISGDRPFEWATVVVARACLGSATLANGTSRISHISSDTSELVDSNNIEIAEGASRKIAASESMTGRSSNTNQFRRWNFHFQNTYIVQGDPGFPAKYSGPNSLDSKGEVQETITADLVAGAKLWRGAEAHMDFLMWQGFGLSQTFGIEAFPNGDAYKAGTRNPNYAFARLFIRQTIGLGGEQEDVSDDLLTLAGKQDISRLTFTIGRLSPLDICDNNTYAHDPHTQFMNWAMMANLTWDYGQNTIGYTTGIAVELNQKKWALRYGFFQMPRDKNGFTGDDQFLMWPHRGAYGPFFRSWAMMAEYERRYSVNFHPGVLRFLSWLDEADFASYKVATAMLLANPPGPNIGQGSGITIPDSARAFRHKYGFGLNLQQEVSKNVGLFSRVGWTDGHCDTWTFTDADWSASLGVSIRGEGWHRPSDTWGIAVIMSGASHDNQQFLKAGGTDMLDGDGALNYNPEKVLETYYDFQIWKTIHASLDYQFITHPAFNRDRSPVSIFGVRLHWEF